MNIKSFSLEDANKEEISADKKAHVERMVEIGEKLEKAPDLETVINILNDNLDFEGVHDYLAPIYVFQQIPSPANLKMVPDPSGFGIAKVLEKFVTEDDSDEDQDGFEQMPKRKGKQGKKVKVTEEKEEDSFTEPKSEVVQVGTEPEKPIEVIPEVKHHEFEKMSQIRVLECLRLASMNHPESAEMRALVKKFDIRTTYENKLGSIDKVDLEAIGEDEYAFRIDEKESRFIDELVKRYKDGLPEQGKIERPVQRAPQNRPFKNSRPLNRPPQVSNQRPPQQVKKEAPAKKKSMLEKLLGDFTDLFN